MIQDILSKLADPPASYRGTPFWAWNAKLDPEEIRTQVRAFHEMGLGGFFMHSRTGLGTPYLGKEWFDCVRAAIDEAKKCGMQPWMYDEDRWPSGSAGGIVTKNKRYRQQALDFEPVSDAALPRAAKRRHTLAWFAVTVSKEALPERELLALAKPKDMWKKAPTILGYRRLAAPDAKLRKGEARLRFFDKTFPNSTWYNGQTYVDTLNPAAIRKFVEITHEAYLRELGEDFGKVVPGCFTDEPNFPARPWTGAFAKTFQKTFGYDICDYLPELFYWVGGFDFRRARHDYLETATALFVKAFSKTIGQWCGRHGLQFTGHALAEDTLFSQSNCVGSAMRFYEFQQAPGIDQLCERSAIYQTAKQCSSVAHQLGRTYRLVEAYGCTGWDFPLEGHKALGDWLVVLGINHRCQHLAWYSMDAEAKRDYPASISRQSPWFRKYKAVDDYFARIGETLGAGTEVIPLLVVHPIESAWGYKLPGWHIEEMRHIDDAFLALTDKLLGEHLDFDYGDEDHLARWGRTAGRKLRLAKAKYDAVLVPEMTTIRKTTLDLLAAYAAKGGRVYTLGEAPAYVDAQPSDEAKKVFAAFEPVTFDTLSAKMSRYARRVSIAEDKTECAAVFYQERESEDGIALFACNTSMVLPAGPERDSKIPMVRDRTIAYPNAVLRVKAPKTTGDVYELDLMTGALHPVAYRYEKGRYVIDAPFGRLESRMFLITTAKLPAKPAKAPAKVADIAIPADGLAYSLDDDNVLVLDAAKWSFDGGALQPETRALDIDRHLRDALGAEHRAGNMTQPWCAAEKKPARQLDIRLEYTFHCQGVAKTPVALAIEHPELYAITLNGVAVKNTSDAWWVDPCLRRLKIPAKALKEGENTLVLTGKFDETMRGLEAMFLLGAFGVSPDGGTLQPLPKTLVLGDVCPQGLANYSGNLAYRFRAAVPKSGAVRLAAGAWRGSAVGFRVNGGDEVFCPFPAYEAVFEKGLRRDGTDEFEVTVYGHRRNAFGPFYVKGGIQWPGWTGPGEMGATDEPVRALVPFGLGAGL